MYKLICFSLLFKHRSMAIIPISEKACCMNVSSNLPNKFVHHAFSINFSLRTIEKLCHWSKSVLVFLAVPSSNGYPCL